MKRRDLLSIGSIFGIVLGLPKVAEAATKLNTNKNKCSDKHELDERYIKAPAYGMGVNEDKGVLYFVPCKNCGILVATEIKDFKGQVAFFASGRTEEDLKKNYLLGGNSLI